MHVLHKSGQTSRSSAPITISLHEIGPYRLQRASSRAPLQCCVVLVEDDVTVLVVSVVVVAVVVVAVVVVVRVVSVVDVSVVVEAVVVLVTVTVVIVVSVVKVLVLRAQVPQRVGHTSRSSAPITISLHEIDP